MPAISKEKLAAIRERLDRIAGDTAAFWIARGPDPEHGGFHGTLNRQGKPIAPYEKGLVQQARHLWAFSMWHQRRQATATVAGIADNLYRFLTAHFLDPQDNSFFLITARDGTLVDRTKLLYGQSFAIYGLARYGVAFARTEAMELALACFHALDKNHHDEVEGGYLQAENPWLTGGAEKEINTHIHLMEAFAELYRARPDPLLGERLRELVRIVALKVPGPHGSARTHFRRDWTPVGPSTVSYGHDIETAWLLLDAQSALGEENAPIKESAIRMGSVAAREGFDANRGGLFDHGIPGSGPIHRRKIWWVQAEALTGLWTLFELTGDPVYLDKLESTLDWIETRQLDRQSGEWTPEIEALRTWLAPRYLAHRILVALGLRTARNGMGHLWKSSYHVLRAPVLVSDGIGRYLNGPAIQHPPFQ